MKRLIIIALLLTLAASVEARGWGKEMRPTSPVHFAFTFRGGFFFPEDQDFREIYGQWTNDMYFMELDWYFFNNFYVEGTAGFYLEDANTIGTITPVPSGEYLQLVMVPLETGLGYRFKFWKDQFLVPYLGGGYNWIYYAENANPGKPVDGWKQGYSVWGGLCILLDRLEPYAAWSLYHNFKIDNSYFELGAKYTHAGDKEGLNLSGPNYTLGLVLEF